MKVYQKAKYHEYRWRKWIEPLIPTDGAGRLFLDLGCNAGFYMRKAEKLGYRTLGVERDPDYISQAPKGLKIVQADLNYYKPPVAFFTLLACVHYHQTEEQVEALLHNLMYSTCNLLVMGRHKKYRSLKSDPTMLYIKRKLSAWYFLGSVNAEKFYTVLFRNPRYKELCVEELYESTKEFVSTVPGFVDFVPGFESFVRGVLDGAEFDPGSSDFFRYLKRRRLRYPLGRCWLYRTMTEDIRDNGIKMALKVKSGRIADGYHRLIILRELGVKRVICRVT